MDIIHNATLVTLDKDDDYGIIADAVLVIKGQHIEWVGTRQDCPFLKYDTDSAVKTHDAQGALITPALIDCHTHIVHGGDRAIEFEMRLNGAGYEELARAGGGINSTVRATRAASLEALIDTALIRLDHLIAEGVSVVEVKSGYGLDTETECQMLRAARALESKRDIKIRTTFLGAHALPDEYRDRPDAYIDSVVIPALEKAHTEGLVDAVDGFCEGIAFTPAQIERVFKKAKDLGLPVKLHAEQLSHLGGTKLAATYQAMSVDHLEYADANDAKAMAEAGSVAVILPGAYYTLRETQQPPIEAFRKYRVPMAVSTDCNPGSSPMTSLLLAMNMSATMFRMTPEEILRGVTHHAAKALGLTGRGRLAKGYVADLAFWHIQHPAELSYRIGFNPLIRRVVGGKL
ncbi:MAG: imidazolonepropionase [Alphaproteobacteria bacterium]|nr:imidazolonepropionase [Alphaproteobacteria bacterium]